MSKGKFLLRMTDKYGHRLYYQSSGVVDTGSGDATDYLRMTSYRKDAQLFFSVKAARAMARKLLKDHGLDMEIVTGDGEVI